MKKLLDETSDDLTRALLEAGRSYRPPAANQAKLLAALGVGAGVGLFSSKAFAWLGTSGGKLTLLGVSVGIAGSVWVALPSAEPARVEARLSATSVPAPVAVAPSDPGGSSLAGSTISNAVPARHIHAPVASEWRRRAAGERKRTATRRDDTVLRSETNLAGPLSAASASPPAVGALLQKEALQKAASQKAVSGAVSQEPESASASALLAASPSVAGLDAPEAPGSGLESEIQLVDAMRGAAQRNDTSSLRRLVDSYRGTFPQGQLRQEVSELALRTLSSGR
ncbi:MAG: hypothetical protein ABI895_25800 [Deltaproteobacteria bacterium]